MVVSCECPVCSAAMQPVCGDDGMTYASECYLKQTNCEEKQTVKLANLGACNSCEDFYCEFGYCQSVNGTPSCVCAAKEACVDANTPICADDGVTYNNVCEMTVESCIQKKKIVRVSDGRCDGKQCDRATPCLYGGTCIGASCICDWTCDTEDYVCGTDRKTYRSECALQKMSCNLDTLITVAKTGQCSEFQSGSKDENVTSDSFETRNTDPPMVETTPALVSCDMDTNCKFEGICDFKEGAPGICRCDEILVHCEGSEDRAVCGGDGVTYKNYCEVRQAQCLTQRNIFEKPLAFCQDEETTENTTDALCNDEQLPLMVDGIYLSCSSCLEKDEGKCEICGSDANYCSFDGVCCAKDPALPACTYSRFGCCPYNSTLASPGPEKRGCPYTCQCHSIGSNGQLCDPTNFQCDCKPGVYGKTCDQCKTGWWGLRLVETQSNEGCIPCQCNTFGSVRTDCDQNTGRCQCIEKVEGLKCDKCVEPGMILTSQGCQKISELPFSEQETCDTKNCGNGQCVVDENSKPLCTCDYTCPDDLDYVCASDGQTYPNPCNLRRQACIDGGLMAIRKGPCEETTTKMETSTSTAMTTTAKTKASTAAGWGGFWWGGGAGMAFADEGADDEEEIISPYVNDRVTCEDDPCANGGTCSNDANLGFHCLCTVHWKGSKCQTANDFTVPRFDGNSFLAYLWDRQKEFFDIHLTIIPTHASGILLYSGSDRWSGDFMSLVLNDGFLQYRFNLGEGSTLLQSEERLVTNRKYFVRIKQVKNKGHLMVTGQPTVARKGPKKAYDLNSDPILYIGHVMPDLHLFMPKRLLQNLGQVSNGFRGCISEIHDSTAKFLLQNTREAQIFDGQNIGQCSSDPCLMKPCLNNGTCSMLNAANFKCTCKASFGGERCEKQLKRARDILRPTGSSVLDVPRFTGNSYLQYRIPKLSSYRLSIGLVIYTTHADGLLFFASQHADGTGDFLLLSLEDLVPVLRFDLGSGVTTLRLNKKVSITQWTMLSLNRTGKTASLSINGETSQTINSMGDMTHLNIKDEVTLGALPPKVAHDKDFLHNPGFQGVIQWASFNGEEITDLYYSASNKHGVRVYSGPPCHPNPCDENFLCIPVFDSYRCDIRL
ncbi:agrin-like isoform X2 [Watersipora subatra]|uniref:agrin-like isoform X2 n=1 Tax=Watersipora subatra TaxID=2589382 RepID=UPI00355B198A